MSGCCGSDATDATKGADKANGAQAVGTTLQEAPPLHSSIVAMVSLASGIAANHPAMGQCQLERLRGAGVPEAQIATVIEIARHIRDEAAEKLDHAFDKAADNAAEIAPEVVAPEPGGEAESCGCTPTPSGQACC